MAESAARQLYEAEVDQVKQWWSDPRWKHTTRRYRPEEIVAKRGSLHPQYLSNDMSKKLWRILEQKFNSGRASTTFGCLDPIMMTQMAKHLETIYVSGWQSAAMASASDEPGPDYADYPYTTLPNKVNQLFKSQQFHDRKQRNARLSRPESERFADLEKDTDYFLPLIADADTGHGGLSATMKLTKLFIENGAAAIHIEDQATGLKGGDGAVMIPICDMIDKLVACRAQADICGTDSVLMCRTDSLGACYITSLHDERDHPFVLGVTNPHSPSWTEHVKQARLDGKIKTAADAAKLEKEWTANARLQTIDQVIAEAMTRAGKTGDDTEAVKTYNDLYRPTLHATVAAAEKTLGIKLHFDWEKARTEKGLYRYSGGLQCVVTRILAYAPYCDIIWPVAYVPDLEIPTGIAKAVHGSRPETKLAWSLVTPFDWTAKMSSSDMKSYSARLGELGYCWQHMTVASVHLAAAMADDFARAFAADPIDAYTRLIQEPEKSKARGVDTLQSWAWMGGDYIENVLNMIKEK